jgi:hypothetical protein
MTFILEVNQALWFGDKLDSSLINPNQIRSYGLSLCDDPFDMHRDLGIDDPSTECFTITLSYDEKSIVTAALVVDLEGETVILVINRPSFCNHGMWLL